MTSLLYFLHAAHHTWLVESEWDERGGIMLIAQPGAFKTNASYTLNSYTDALCLSDVNIKSMTYIRDQVVSGVYHTLVFGEMEKLYARNPNTAANIEGVIKQLIDEGLRQFSFENPSAVHMPARALVVAAMTPAIYSRLMHTWEQSGFLRRFLQLHYALADPKIPMDSVEKNKKLEFSVPAIWQTKARVRFNLDDKEMHSLRGVMRHRGFDSTPYALLVKIACILKHRHKDQWQAIIRDVGEALGKNGALLTI